MLNIRCLSAKMKNEARVMRSTFLLIIMLEVFVNTIGQEKEQVYGLERKKENCLDPWMTSLHTKRMLRHRKRKKKTTEFNKVAS